MNDEEKEKYAYVGDGVYAHFDGEGFWLRTGHHSDKECDNKIYLGSRELANFLHFVGRSKFVGRSAK